MEIPRIKETTESEGTGPISLSGPPLGFQSFSTLGEGNSSYYLLWGDSGFEKGVGTYLHGTFRRDTILESSNGDAAVDFGPGTKQIIMPDLMVDIASEFHARRK